MFRKQLHEEKEKKMLRHLNEIERYACIVS